jgi:hypothetical protein
VRANALGYSLGFWRRSGRLARGEGCGLGSHRAARRVIRSQVIQPFWLRRASVWRQYRMAPSRKLRKASLLSGSGRSCRGRSVGAQVARHTGLDRRRLVDPLRPVLPLGGR